MTHVQSVQPNEGYIVCCSNDKVYKITPDGKFTVLYDAPKFFYLRGIVATPDRTLFVTDNTNHVIRRITPDGKTCDILSGHYWSGSEDGDKEEANFNHPSGITCAPDGTLYVADSGNHRIRRVTLEGTVATLCGSTQGAKDGRGGEAEFNYPEEIAYGPDGCLYVADSLNCTIRKVTTDGAVTTLCGEARNRGSDDGKGREARFSSLKGIAVAEDGTLFVCDNTAIRKITPDGIVSLFCGSPSERGFVDGKGSEARFSPHAGGVVMAPDGTMYVADRENSAIRKVTRDGTVTTLVSGVSLRVGMFFVPTFKWSTATHKYFPLKVRRQIVTVMMMAQKKPDGLPYHPESLFTTLPTDILKIIFYFLAS